MFSHAFSSVGTRHTHTFRNFKRSSNMLYAKPWEHPNAVATLAIVILLSTGMKSPPAAQLLLSHSQEGGLVGHHATFERASENFSTQL
jgi:hypothetical protein